MIKNEQWSPNILETYIKLGTIEKPKYQRQRKWDYFPKKEKNPSEKMYIEFLLRTQNSVHAITFGQDGSNYCNIDGNNRINAILHFLIEPFFLFPEKLEKIMTFIFDKINEDIANIVRNIIMKIRYDDLMTFRYNKYFIENMDEKIYSEHLKIHRDELGELFDELIDNMKMNGKDRFDTDVKIMVNIFNGYTTGELSDVFGEINRYHSGLTEQEALASKLFNITDFKIEDRAIEINIIEQLKKYYDDRTNGEKLRCYTYDEDNDLMNAYDFIVGLQNYAHEKCELIHESDNDGLSLFFKVFKSKYGGHFDTTFTSKNINDFIKYINYTINILDKLKTNIFT
jgi:hypothetical protein